MCVPSRIQHSDTAALKGVIIFLGLPPKKSDIFAKWQVYNLINHISSLWAGAGAPEKEREEEEPSVGEEEEEGGREEVLPVSDASAPSSKWCSQAADSDLIPISI